VINECGPHYKLVFVGDALMAPYELLGTSGYGEEDRVAGIQWLSLLRNHFERAVWLNPEPPHTWRGNTIEAIASVVPMFPLTLEGLGEAVHELVKGRGQGR
jgi:hypothetical protein